MPAEDNLPNEVMDMAVLWVKAEPNLHAFVAAAVWDVYHAEDVLQEVATVVSKNFSSYDPSRPFLPRCLGIARLKVMEYLRSQSRGRMVLSDATLLTLESAVQSLSDDYLASRSAALQHCVRRLKGRQRQTVELRYLKELTVELLLSELASNAGSQRDSRRLTATTAVREESISKTGDLLYD